MTMPVDNIRSATRKIGLCLVDMVMVILSLFLAMGLRFEWEVPQDKLLRVLNAWPYLTVAYLVVFLAGGMYSVLWRYAGERELIRQVVFTAVAGILTILENYVLGLGISRSMLVNMCLLTCALTLLTRIAFKGWHVLRQRYRDGRDAKEEVKPILIVGAGDAASYLVDQCMRHVNAIGKPVALVDDSQPKQGLKVKGVYVRGKIEDIPKLVSDLEVRDIIIAMPSVKGERMREIIAVCNSTRCRVRMLSDPEQVHEDLRRGKLTMREPNIADFLSRDEIKLDNNLISSYIEGKTVLVTGGGGSIGSELCRQVIQYRPKLLLIFDIYENCAYELNMELMRKYGADCPVKVLVGSIRDKKRLDEVMEEYRPQVVLHAAAHKHVPLMEISPSEAVKNNVFGTFNLLQSASEHGVERLVQLSTDKAVNPTNVMGATKRVTEMLIQSFASRTGMKCMAVRFGNVLGSHGSVIPLFEEQIKAGGPVTITDPEITRYFMTIPEAAQLVLEAGGMAKEGSIFVLDMGEPVRIMDLAEKLIRYYGFEPGEDIEIKVTGLRPGEKLYEELLTLDERNGMTRTAHDKIFVAMPPAPGPEELSRALASLRTALSESDEAVVAALERIVPGYHPAGRDEKAAV